jgi:hypothetical protein
MPSNIKSPFTTSFHSAIKRGTPYLTVIGNIAKRTGKSPEFIFGSLFKAGVVNRQKFNGTWLYWPAQWDGKANVSNKKECQFSMWQAFVQWSIWNGWTTPEKLANNTGSQAEFENFCKKFWGKQFNGTVSTTRTRPAAKAKTRTVGKTTARKRSTVTSKTTTGSKTNSKVKKNTTVKAGKTSKPVARKTTTAGKAKSQNNALRFAGSTSRRTSGRSYRRAA